MLRIFLRPQLFPCPLGSIDGRIQDWIKVSHLPGVVEEVGVLRCWVHRESCERHIGVVRIYMSNE
jgi:hypothetical protein